jgi:hypothetical protein
LTLAEAAPRLRRRTVDTITKLVSGVSAELDALPPVPLLHDTTTKNVIVTPGGCFSSIVDVDELCISDPSYVVALTLASLMASGGPTRYVDAWMNSANCRNDRTFRIYVGLFIVDFMSEHGQEFKPGPVLGTVGRRAAGKTKAAPLCRWRNWRIRLQQPKDVAFHRVQTVRSKSGLPGPGKCPWLLGLRCRGSNPSCGTRA